jgi:AcrR family transcriptional regulator
MTILDSCNIGLTVKRRTQVAPHKRAAGLSPDPVEARQEILTAAEDLILHYGVAKTTMDDIGKEAGVSRPTVYRYFSDRDALLTALIERRARAVFEQARAFIMQHDTFSDRLVEGLIYLVDLGRNDPIVRLLVSPEHLRMDSPLTGGSELAVNLTAEMWEPVFAEAAERSEIRRGYDRNRVAQWLTLLQFVLVGRLDIIGPDDPSHRIMLREFVLPAFLPIGAEVPTAG